MLFPIAASGPQAETMTLLTDEYNDSQDDVTIEPVYSGSYADTMTKARAMFDAGKPPDLLIASSSELFNLIDLDMVVPFEDIVGDAEWLDSFYPALMVNSTLDDKTYGVPFQRSTVVQYVNMDALAGAGIDAAPTTWDELESVATAVSQAGTTDYGLEIPSSAFADWLFAALAYQNGIELSSADGTEAYIDDPASIEALEYWIHLGEVGASPSGSVEWATTPKDFIEQKAAIIWTTSGNLASIRDQASFDFAVTPLPSEKQAGSPTGGANLYVFKTGDEGKQTAAAEFVEWITAPEQSARWSIATGYVASSPAAYETTTMTDYVADFPEALVARDQLADFTRALGWHGNSRVNKALQDAIVAALVGDASAKDALEGAQATAEEILARYQ